MKNQDNGKFEMHTLPIEAQIGPIYGILPQHLDNDSLTGLLLIGMILEWRFSRALQIPSWE